ncbi:MAG TPA: thioredoxin [Rhodothermales bacterium]|nr:thioredoxin [Rhodothermales bacterium]
MADNANIVTATDQNFQETVLGSDKPVLVDFWAAWCGPCRMIAPLVEQLASEYGGRAVIAKVDVDENPQVSMQFGIRSIPALIFFKDGRPVDQVVGAVPKRMLAERLDALVGQEV